MIIPLAIACGSGDEQTMPTPTPPTGGSDPMVVQTLADRTEPASDLSVVGYVVVRNGGRLCDVLLESFPPQCGPASVELAGYEDLDVEFTEAQGVRWTENKVAFRGRWKDSVFTPSRLLD